MVLSMLGKRLRKEAHTFIGEGARTYWESKALLHCTPHSDFLALQETAAHTGSGTLSSSALFHSMLQRIEADSLSEIVDTSNLHSGLDELLEGTVWVAPEQNMEAAELDASGWPRSTARL